MIRKSILYFTLFIILGLTACDNPSKDTSRDHHSHNWSNRTIDLNPGDSLYQGMSYLSVYSEIYSYSAVQTFQLTATVSIHNTSLTDSLFIKKADYYNTNGKLLRSYIDKPIYVKPLESIQIVIDETDEEGGTGANFIFDWAVKNQNNEPYFEAVMISTSGQQGMSFTTKGIRTK